MTLEDFSQSFDTLVHSYMRFRDFDKREPQDTIEFDEYEKSVFLTKAQEEIALSLYNGKNPYNESFEQTEELRRYLAPLVEEAGLTPDTNITGNPLGMDSKHKFFTLPEDVWFITYEAVKVNSDSCENINGLLDVYPVRQDEYHKLKRNPFRGANSRRALRFDLSDGVIEIVSIYTTVEQYYIRYIRKPNPIILEDMPNGVTIEGEYLASDCELPDSLHQRILETAVAMALQSKGYRYNNKQENK